jgi:hypothetical protein
MRYTFPETVLHRFYGGQISNTDGGDPIGPLAVDSSGAVYGATRFGGEGCPTKSGRSCGTIFQLVLLSPKEGNGRKTCSINSPAKLTAHLRWAELCLTARERCTEPLRRAEKKKAVRCSR